MTNFKIETIDNFLNNNHLEELCKIAEKLNVKTKFNIFHNEINKDNTIIKSTIDEDLVLRINDDCLNKSLKILKVISPEKYDLFTYSDLTLIKTEKNSSFPIHDDSPNKLLSGVIYLSPENNLGTSFYSNKKGNNQNEIKWKRNRAVFFSRKEKETWHSFGADGINHRTVLVFNLNTSNKNLRRIYKIENKSYLLGMFRYKINPTLHRLFNFTI
tara:strand:+ start:985 stop:1626 length:642 start_codon:yes stop_codon:yes gene_type:complete